MTERKPRPKPLKRANLEQLRVEVEDLLDFLDSGDITSDGVRKRKQPIFEAALVALYGPDFWDYYNERTSEL